MRETKALGPDIQEAYTYKELPIGATSIGLPKGRKTGLWRYLRPKFVEGVAPCEEACPAGNWVHRFVRAAADADLDEAWRAITLENPFPGICGRVCYHPCEGSCNRQHYDGSISIHLVERAVADAFIHRPLLPPAYKRKNRGNVAIVGSGPAGLACAYFLSAMGHRATLFEALSELGGVPRIGIPAYRLPRQVLDREISKILALGVDIKTGCRIGENIPFSDLLSYDAIFLANGASNPQLPKIPGVENKGVFEGLEFLFRHHLRKDLRLGEGILVIGGGNVAIDVARTLIRLGCSPTVVYRRTRHEMPAYAEEVDAALEEGVHFRYLLSPALIQMTEKGRLTLVCNKMKIEGVDQQGRVRTVPTDGEKAFFEADQIVVATGEMPDLSFLPKEVESEKGLISVTAWGQTTHEKVFAGGDTINQPWNVAAAIGSAKRAAIAMDHFMNGENLQNLYNRGKLAKTMRGHLGLVEPQESDAGEIVHSGDLNLAYSHHSSPRRAKKLPVHKRVDSFMEVDAGIDLKNAADEAGRCFSCGSCRMCGNCYVFCPEGAVQLDSSTGRYTINYDYCKGCTICQNECPAGAIKIETEGEV